MEAFNKKFLERFENGEESTEAFIEAVDSGAINPKVVFDYLEK